MTEPASINLAKSPGFLCFKSKAPVHYPHRWQRDALIQAALDPAIASIEPVGTPAWPPYVEFGFVIEVAQTPFVCLLTERPSRIGDHFPDKKVLTLRRSALKVEPLHSTARAVWSRKRISVDPVARFRVLEAAGARVDGVEATSIIRQIEISQSNSIDQLFAMIAQGFLVGDLAGGLRGGTLLRPGPSFRIEKESIPAQRLRQMLIGAV